MINFSKFNIPASIFSLSCIVVYVYTALNPHIWEFFAAGPGYPIYNIFLMHFAHGSLFHLVMNIFVIMFAAGFIGKFRDNAFIMKLMVYTAIGAGIFAYFLSSGPTIGASGIAYGLMGYVFIAMSTMQKSFNHFLTWLLVVNFALSIAIPNISFIGHFGGFVVGIYFGYQAYKSRFNRLVASMSE